jgi:CBS domain-containing protein
MCSCVDLHVEDSVMDMNQWIATELPVDYTLPVSTIMTTHAWSASIDDSLAEVEKIMAKRNLASVPIMDSKGIIFGIINWRDLLRCRAAKTNLRAVQAWEICSFKPIAVGPDTSIQEVAKLMLEKEIPDVVVMEDGSIKGFVSTFDFVQRLMSRE